MAATVLVVQPRRFPLSILHFAIAPAIARNFTRILPQDNVWSNYLAAKKNTPTPVFPLCNSVEVEYFRLPRFKRILTVAPMRVTDVTIKSSDWYTGTAFSVPRKLSLS